MSTLRSAVPVVSVVTCPVIQYAFWADVINSGVALPPPVPAPPVPLPPVPVLPPESPPVPAAELPPLPPIILPPVPPAAVPPVPVLAPLLAPQPVTPTASSTMPAEPDRILHIVD